LIFSYYFLLVFGSLMNANGWRYETLGISELLHYQGTTDFDARTEARITTPPPMFYDRVLGAGIT